eukprot:scaffold57118_cov52-Attheya_sp.AAC.1
MEMLLSISVSAPHHTLMMILLIGCLNRPVGRSLVWLGYFRLPFVQGWWLTYDSVSHITHRILGQVIERHEFEGLFQQMGYFIQA